MNGILKTGLACAGLILLSGATAPAQAFGLGNCYVRADGGYSWSRDPDIDYTRPQAVQNPPVQNIELGNAGFFEAGFGCGSQRQEIRGSLKDTVVVSRPSGLRGDVVFGFRSDRDFHAEPDAPIAFPGPDPIDTEFDTLSVMFNIYYDFHLGGPMGLMPYVGAGVGVARHDFGTVTIVNGGTVVFDGGNDTSFGWQVMAGVGKEISPGLVLDLGYRYVDLGDATASDGTGHVIEIEDLGAHEIKFGVRVALDSLK